MYNVLINIQKEVILLKKRLISTNARHRITYTVAVAVILILVLLMVSSYVYSEAKRDGYEELHIQTREIKTDMELQVKSDMENLTTMARFAATLYENGEGFNLLTDSYKKIGIIDDIGVLTEDNMLYTRAGVKDVTGALDFEKEAQRGTYISNIEYDVTATDKKIIRSAVPVIVDGKTVAILYGATSIETLEERFTLANSVGEYQLYVFDRKTGDFIIDTRHNETKNISALSDREFKEGYSYEQLYSEIQNSKDCEHGSNTSFISKITGEQLYMHHSPLDIDQWHIMLALPSDSVFHDAHRTINGFALLFLFAVLVMALYLMFVMRIERRDAKINSYASRIRKLLLEINSQDDSVRGALEQITRYAKSRSAFFVDAAGMEYAYIIPSLQSSMLMGDDRKFFVDKLSDIMSKVLGETGSSMGVMRLELDAELEAKDKELYDFLINHGIDNICFAGIINKRKEVYLLGVVNCKKNKSVKDLLNEIMVCFSIAIYNKKHLNKTEVIAVTDPLTGLYNRMAYKRELRRLEEDTQKLFSCIYIDVCELHVINNRFGHAAGDNMLLYISDALKKVFADSKIYRMGGDEFLVFCENVPKEKVEENIEELISLTEKEDYHISVGYSFQSVNKDTELLVKEAEKRMYEDKAEYYQKKSVSNLSEADAHGVEHMVTGIRELDTLLSAIGDRFVGIYCVNLKTDIPRAILIPEYLTKYQTPDAKFKDIMTEYIHDRVSSDYHRPMLNFLEYDVLKRQLLSGNIPSIIYERIKGDNIKLTVYPITVDSNDNAEALWLFEKI